MSIRKLQFSGDTDEIDQDPELESNFEKILTTLAQNGVVRDQDRRANYNIDTLSQRVGFVLSLIACHEDELALSPNYNR